MPNPSPAQWNLIAGARKATVAHDGACSPFQSQPAFSPGHPGSDLTSVLGVLKQPPAPADSVALRFFDYREPGGVYRDSIRLVRAMGGFALYLVPSTNVTGWRRVPTRCLSEQAAALRRELRHSKPVPGALQVQARYLIWQQYEARHPEGVCLAEVDERGNPPHPAGGSIGCGWNVPEIEQGIAGLGGDDSPPGGNWFHGIVPDGVASVTLQLPGGEGKVTARVVNNIYLTRLPSGSRFPVKVVWRSASGSVIRATNVP
jgi:hypothetical protein